MDPYEFNQRLRDLANKYANNRDPEAFHSDTDDLMEQALSALGFDLSPLEGMTRWYA